MRLLKACTLEFEEFLDERTIPPYAILSHRWEDEEVTYKEMLKPTRRALAETKQGFQKIKACAAQAIKDDLKYIWVDTCCIDKISSAELSEAINSMFRWYRAAAVCYAYLCDTPALPVDYTQSQFRDWSQEFKNSIWFLRGWTLQELIAPRKLVFYTGDWTPARTREELAYDIATRTGIPFDVLTSGDFLNTSIAQRMSWAAQRKTTRVEDSAYCLLGLFDISMPLLYGEGERAFIRLQHEIIKTSDDLSIFAWKNDYASFGTYSGLFATSPSLFAGCRYTKWVRPGGNGSFEVTNKGLRISLTMLPDGRYSNESIAVLHGVTKNDDRNPRVGLYMQKVGDDQYARVATYQLADVYEIPEDTPATSFYVRQPVIMERGDHSRARSILFQVASEDLSLTGVEPSDRWDSATSLFTYPTPLFSPKEGIIPALFILDDAVRYLDDPQPTVNVRVALDKPWGEMVTCSMTPESRWKITTESTSVHSFGYRITCRKEKKEIEIVVRRGLVNQIARLLLSISSSGLRRNQPSLKRRAFENTFAARYNPW